MVDNAPEQPQLDINVLIEAYQNEIIQLSARAITAEAELRQLRIQNAVQRQMIEAGRRTEPEATEEPQTS